MLTTSNRTNTRHSWVAYNRATQVYATWRGDGAAGGADWDYVAYSNQAAVCCSTRKQVLAHVKWPASTPGGQHLRQWLDAMPRPGQAAPGTPTTTMTATPDGACPMPAADVPDEAAELEELMADVAATEQVTGQVTEQPE